MLILVNSIIRKVIFFREKAKEVDSNSDLLLMQKNGEYIYFNNSACSWPLPAEVEKVYMASIKTPPGHGRSTFEGVDSTGSCRNSIATLLGCTTEEVSIISGVTLGLNIIVNGIGLEAGDTVITSSWEHNSVLRPLHYFKNSLGVHIDFIQRVSGNIDTEHLTGLLENKKVKAFILSSVSNVSGASSGWQSAFDIARKYNVLTVLDASQTFGLSHEKTDWAKADIVVAPSHKAVRSIPGCAFLKVKNGFDLVQRFSGGTGRLSELLTHPESMPMRFEFGTQSYSALQCFDEALKRVLATRHKNYETIKRNRTYFCENLTGIGSFTIHSPRNSETGIISITSPFFEPDEISQILFNNASIICRTGLHCAPLIHEELGTRTHGTVRFSLSELNTIGEIDRCLDLLGSFK